MSRVIAIVNQKGGVGKTTTTVNLGAYLAEMGKKVLLIDADPQGNTTSGIGLSKSKIQRCVYDVLINDLDLGSVVLPTTYKGLFVAPATIQLAGAEIEMVSALNREFRLRKALEGIRENYDYILMDCPPSLGLLTVNALTAADSVLVPIQCEYYALEGLSQLLNTITLVQKHLNPDLKIAGVALTMFDPRTNLSQQVIDEVQKYFGDKVFKTIIPRNIRLSEAPGYGQAILTYDDKSRGAIAYRELAEEVVALG